MTETQVVNPYGYLLVAMVGIHPHIRPYYIAHDGNWTADPVDAAFFRRLPSLTGWAVAELYGLHYDGDSDAIAHGGTFYSLTQWAAFGYAPCVELCPLTDGGRELLMVSAGTVNRPDADTLRKALAMCDLPATEDAATVVDAVKSYCGAEPDAETGRTYELANWPNEWRIWKSIHPLLLSLSQQ